MLGRAQPRNEPRHFPSERVSFSGAQGRTLAQLQPALGYSTQGFEDCEEHFPKWPKKIIKCALSPSPPPCPPPAPPAPPPADPFSKGPERLRWHLKEKEKKVTQKKSSSWKTWRKRRKRLFGIGAALSIVNSSWLL
ncbi:uncharacterized protein LOC144327334 isoform X2 [Podarcis muralis]